jgi:hypothetical protein
LEKLPRDILEAFAVTVKRIEGQAEYMALRGMQILTWVYLAERLLSVEELLHALATKKEHLDLDRDNFVNRETFLENCMGLVIIDEQTSTVHLVHKSLQDYLSTRCDLFKNGHNTIAQTCLTYLKFQSVITRSEAMASKAENPEDVSNDLALVGYAACQWGHHLRKSGQEGSVVELAQKYLSMDPQKCFWSQWHLHRHIYGRYDSDTKSSVAWFSKLHIIAYFGTYSVLSKIAPAATEVDSKDSNNRSPLWWASSNGYKDVVRWFLENGAQPNSEDKDGQTPLSRAIEIGNKAVVEQLLIKGAKVDYFYKIVSESDRS